MKRYILALDLRENLELIHEYDDWHKKVWPEVLKNIEDSGILKMEIFRFYNRLCMIIETTDDFTFERKGKMDKEIKKVMDWEKLMWDYQVKIPGSKPKEKWVLMDSIFEFNSNK
ncbi:L-rhamnose mutarotase [Pedobacter arcticus]|uniref:L-rhamnose mutarotase n=1 Tax=Pedobacter arcticus TaxID=752140 RepID=UPI0003640B48|nr:L-rhamnose mutarotase [Pedobacter arcticus]